MALEISGYVDPGVYTAERVVPGSVSLSTVPNTVCLIGAGDRTKRAINENSAFIMANLMKGVVEHGTGYRARELNRPVAGKTGT